MTRVAAALALLCLAVLAHAQCPYQETGLENWSNAATWGGSVPAAGSSVTIPVGKKVLLDVSPPQLVSITVLGQLIFKDIPINLNINWMKIDGGRLAVGSATCAINSKIIITLFGARSTANDIGPDLGTKGIAVLNGGTAEFFGAVSGPSWTRLSATAAAAATQITLADAVTWPVGSQIMITSTDYIGSDYAPEQAENNTITARSADGRTLTLQTPLQYMHWGISPEAAEVGLLTRNIVLRGDDSSVASQFGGHLIFYYQAVSAKLRGVEVTRMGQQGVLGRYPIHYHMMQDQVAAGHYVQDCSIHDNLQRCITIHNTNGVLIKNNVGYRTLGHCMFIEDGAEELNTFDHNVVSSAVQVPTNPVIPSDTRAACFWITNPNNTYINNAAASCEFGFWFAFPMHPNGKSLNLYSSSLRLWPRFLPILRFDSNVAHSHLDSGFFVDQMPDVNGVVAQQEYNPRQPPFVAGQETPWSYTRVDVTFTNCISYKNRQHGIWSRGDGHIWSGAQILDNRIGFDTPGGPSVLRDSVITGESANIGTPVSPGWLADYNGRSRPVTWSNSEPIIGWETYDASGPDFVYNVEFVNFVSNSLRKAGALGLLPNSKNIMLSDFASAKLRFTNSPGRYWWPNYDVSEELDDPKCSLVLDADGTGTGSAQGAWVHTKGPFLDDGSSCAYNSDFNVHVCPPNREGYIYFELQNENVGGTDFAGTNVIGNLLRATWYQLGDTTGARKLDIVGSPYDQATRDSYRGIAMMRRGYTVRFLNNHPTPPKLRFWADNGMVLGDWIVMAIPYPSSAQPFTVVTGWANTPCTAAASLQELSPTKYFYDVGSQHLYLMLAKQDHTTTLFNGIFPVNPGSGIYTTVTASCTGSACRPTNLAIPAALPKLEDVFQANLQPCQSVPPTSSTAQGTAFFSWDPRTFMLSYNIYHSLFGMITMMHAHNAAIGANGGVDFGLWLSGQGGNPIRGAQRLTRDQYINLINGNLYVNVHTNAFPGGEIRGQIGCVGTCTPPPQISTQPPCTPSGSNVVIYQDSVQGWPNWRIDQWGGATYVGNNNEAPLLCAASTAQVKVTYVDNGAIQFGHSAPQTITQTHIQFYARTTSSDPFVLQLTLKRSDSDSGTQLTVTSNYIDNFAITPTWTRVRIPLSAFGSGAIQYFVFAQPWTSNYVARDLFIDEFRFITPGAEPMSAPISAGSIVAYSPNICTSATSPPAAAVNVATTTSASTTSVAATTSTASTSNAATAAANAATTNNAATTSTASVSTASTAAAATAAANAATTNNAATTSASTTNAVTAAAANAATTNNAATTSNAATAAAAAAASNSAASASTTNAAAASTAATAAASTVAATTSSASSTTVSASTTTAASSTTTTAFASTSTAALSNAATTASSTAAASNAAAATTASTSTTADAATVSATVSGSTSAAATTNAATTAASTSSVATTLASVTGASSTASFAATTTESASTTAVVSTAVEAALSTSVAASTSGVSTSNSATATSSATGAAEAATTSASSTATSDSAVAGTTGAATTAAATSESSTTAATTGEATTGEPDVPQWIITLLTEGCLNFAELASRLEAALGIDAARFILLSYPGCTKRTNEMTFFIARDYDGSLSRGVADYLNSASDPSIVSASVQSNGGKGASSHPKTVPLTIIVIVASAIAVSVIILLVLVVILAVRRNRLRSQPHYTRSPVAPSAGHEVVLEGLYSNTGSNRVNNPLLSNYANQYDDGYA